MQVLENNSTNTSYAAAYFAATATVTENGSQYTVTSTITTDTSLGDWPVQLSTIDGSNPTISRSQAGSKQTITYSFATTNLAARHNAQIKVDVASINYHHNYTVGLVLDTSTMPASTTTQTQTQPQTTQATHSTADAAKSETAATANQASTTSDSDKSTSSPAAAASSKSKTKSSSKAPSNQKATVKKATTTGAGTTVPVIPILIGALVVGVGAAVGTVAIQRRRHRD
jgi:heme-binding NEAT domain protein